MLNRLRGLIADAAGWTDFQLGEPEFEKLGHFTTNAAFAVAKRDKTKSLEAAERLKTNIAAAAPKNFIEKIDVTPPGFLNFWMSQKALQQEFARIRRQGEKYGQLNIGKGGKAIVEYSSPNIAKPMHVGHLRSTIIGDSLANIHKFLGYRVVRWNYLGDWGTQFGKLIAAYKLWGDKRELERTPIETLLKLYVRFHEELKGNPDLERRGREEFKKLEEGDRENKRLWQWFRKESLKDFEGIYRALGVKFDVEIGESFYDKDLKPLVKYLGDKKILKVSEGALIVPLDAFGLPPALLEKSDGASLYLTREIANLFYRLKRYHPKKILYVVGHEQTLHFEQLIAVAKLLKLSSTELVHVKYGMVTGEGGKKISTREGSSIALENLIFEALTRARKVVDAKQPELSEREKDKISKLVGIAALKYNDLSQSRLSDISFDWDKMLNFEGNSAPYLLYAYARLRSILKKARLKKADPKFLTATNDLNLVLELSRFPEVMRKAGETCFPHYIAGYLYDLSRAVNRFYETEPVLKADKGIREARLALIDTAAAALKTGLNLLGIQTVEKM